MLCNRLRVLGIAATLFLTLCQPIFAAEAIHIPLHIHLVEGLSMTKSGVEMPAWVSPKDIETIVIPEVNLIWSQAGIVFEAIEVSSDDALLPDNQKELIDYIVNAKRDDQGKSDPKRIKKLNKLIDFATATSDAINVYLVPYLGQTSQGNAKPKRRRVVVGQWTDKPSKGKQPPEKFRLTESRPMKEGSLSRTLAHELGHILGLRHPDKSSQTVFNRLMGGKRPGYTLTKKEVDTARDSALRLASKK